MPVLCLAGPSNGQLSFFFAWTKSEEVIEQKTTLFPAMYWGPTDRAAECNEWGKLKKWDEGASTMMLLYAGLHGTALHWDILHETQSDKNASKFLSALLSESLKTNFLKHIAVWIIVFTCENGVMLLPCYLGNLERRLGEQVKSDCTRGIIMTS